MPKITLGPTVTQYDKDSLGVHEIPEIPEVPLDLLVYLDRVVFVSDHKLPRPGKTLEETYRSYGRWEVLEVLKSLYNQRHDVET